MTYYITRIIDCDFDTAIERIRAALRDEGFGILSDIDIQATLKAKLNDDFHPYRILGACNPALARRALNADDKIGVMLPCNVIVQGKGSDGIEVAAIDPVVAMAGTDNPEIEAIAQEVREKLQTALDRATLEATDD